MNGKVAKRLRKFAAKATIGKPEATTRVFYRKMKKRWNATPKNLRGPKV